MKRIGVLASGGGTNLQSLIDYFNGANSPVARVVWVGSNRASSGALVRAQSAGIPSHVLPDAANGAALLTELRTANVELLVLAGYLKLIPRDVVQTYRGRLLNIHPSLLPAFGGDGMYGHRVHEAVLQHGVKVSGATVHFVDDQFDRGAIVAQWPVWVLATDTATSLAERVLAVEHQLLIRTVEAVASGAVTLNVHGQVVGDVGLPDIQLPASPTS